MQVTVDDVERIKADFEIFEEFATRMFEGIGEPGDFQDFCDELNGVIVDLAVGPDSPAQLVQRLRYVFRGRIRYRKALRRQLHPDQRLAYRDFLSVVDRDKALGLERNEMSALRRRHEHFLREFLARYPIKPKTD